MRALFLGVRLGLLLAAFAAGPVQAQEPLLHWPLDDVSGATTPDVSGNEFPGTLTRPDGGKSDGRFGGAFNTRTSPTNAQIRLNGQSALQPQQFTIVAWIRAQPSEFTNERGVIDYVNNSCSGPSIWGFRNQEADLRFKVNGGGDSLIDDRDVYDGRWHMIAATVDGRRHTAYLDGAPVRTLNQPAPGALDYGSGAKTLSVGGSACESSPLRDTDLDEIRFYNNDLTADQIAYMSRSRLSDPPEFPVPPNDPGWSGLVGQWHLDGTNFGGVTASTGPVELSGDTVGTHVPGRFGNAAPTMLAPDSTSMETPRLTLMGWIKRSGAPAAGTTIMAKGSFPGCGSGNSYKFDVAPDGSLRWTVVTTNGAGGFFQVAQGGAPATLWNGQWHAIAGTFDGPHIALWVDGVKVATTPGPGESQSRVRRQRRVRRRPRPQHVVRHRVGRSGRRGQVLRPRAVRRRDRLPPGPGGDGAARPADAGSCARARPSQRDASARVGRAHDHRRQRAHL